MWRKPLSYHWLVVLLAAAVWMGCKPADQIALYSVPKPESIIPEGEAKLTPASRPEKKPAAPTAPTRMLAAMFVVGESGWFFKATGDIEKLGAKETEIVAFLKTVRFPSEQKPTWELPAGWTERGQPSEFRYTTLRMGDNSPPLDLAVSRLDKSLPNETAFVLVNINRWRGQLGLKPLKPDGLERETTTLEIDGKTCVLVNYVGQMAAGGGMQPPFAAGQPPPGPRERTQAPPAEAAKDLKYEKPAGWKQGTGNAFSQAAFTVADGERKIDITISGLNPGAGSVLDNINRWRGQIKLPPINPDELAANLKTIAVSDKEGKYVALFGEGVEGKGLLGVILETPDRMWFVKLIGDAELAKREQPNFEAFVKSLRVP